MESSIFDKNSGTWNSCNAVLNKLFDSTPEPENKFPSVLNSVDTHVRKETFASSELDQQTTGMDDVAETVKQCLQWQTLFTYAAAGSLKLDGVLLNQLLHFLKRVLKEIRRLDEATQAICVFCRNNHETFEIYSSHRVKDRDGRVTCPILRNIVCPICSATGDAAHTVRFCPQAVIQKRSALPLPPALLPQYCAAVSNGSSLLNCLQLYCARGFGAASSSTTVSAVLR